MKRKRVRLGGIVGGILLGSFLLFGMAGLRINCSASLPIGLYVKTANADALAEFCPGEPFSRLAAERGYRERGSCPDGFTPLLKPVVARAGDVIELSPAGISVNGVLLPNTAPLKRDSHGRALQSWPFGVYRVRTGELWVASSYNARSFDARYFGPISAGSVREWLRPLAVWSLFRGNFIEPNARATNVSERK